MCLGGSSARISRRTALIGTLSAVATGYAATQSAAAEPRPDGLLAIVGATVFDGHRSWGTATVLINGPEIVAIGPDIPLSAGIEVREARGKTLLPGLIDAHVHALGMSSDPVRFGVTTELDMFSDLGMLGPYRRQRASTAPTVNADVWSAGTLATAPGGHGTQFGLDIPTLGPRAGKAEIERFVNQRVADGSDFLKVIMEDGSVYGLHYPTLRRKQVELLVRAAHERGLQCVVHVTKPDDAVFAFEAGADGIAHVPVRPMSDAAVKTVAGHGGFVISTLAVFNAMSGAGLAHELLHDPLIAPWLSRAQREALDTGGQHFPGYYVPARDNIGALHDAGVPILAGTDFANTGVARGPSQLGELDLLVEAGLSPVDALRAATAAPAEHFGLTDRGTIAPGRRADLVLVDGDATKDIGAVRAIDTIWRNGCPIDRRV